MEYLLYPFFFSALSHLQDGAAFDQYLSPFSLPNDYSRKLAKE
jgi:hypothetical protein